MSGRYWAPLLVYDPPQLTSSLMRRARSCNLGFDPAGTAKAGKAKVPHFPSDVLTSQALHSDSDTTSSNAAAEHIMKSAPQAATALCSVRNCSQQHTHLAAEQLCLLPCNSPGQDQPLLRQWKEDKVLFVPWELSCRQLNLFRRGF